MSHADEVITDVNRRRVRARAHEDSFTIAWDYPGRTLLEIRILRSTERPAQTADDGVALAQELVYQDVTGSFRDTGLRSDVPYYYAVFARHPGGDWVRWEEYSLPCRPKTGMGEFGRLWSKAMKNRISIALALGLALAGLTLLAAGTFLPAAVASSGGDSGKDGDKQPAAASAASAAAASAEADPSVAAVLDGTGAIVAKSTPWGGSDGQPAGYRIEYHWPVAKEVNEVWPLLRSDASTPQPPYDSSDYRIRATGVTALQVDVLLDGDRVIQAMPVNGDTDFTLQEQTWAPFSWVPWFTANPWVLAPVFIALVALLMVRAWLRSRAWNRRLPSMTRHDRQFIGRLAILLFLLAGFAWQFYEGWYAATGPSVDPSSTSAGSLAALPLLLIPPGLFVAALALELGAAQHRGSWALVAVLAGAASAYELASAMTGVTTNLNLTYFILLAVLCLIAIPRAFSAGKMGWSRGPLPRYG